MLCKEKNVFKITQKMSSVVFYFDPKLFNMEVVVTSENFDSLKNGNLPLVVDFWAEWCGPCKMISPIISQLAEEYDGRLVVGKCNVEESEELAAEYGIRNIPTLLFFKNGQLVDKFVGAANKVKLQEKFDANL